MITLGKLYEPFNINDDLKRYGGNLLSTDAEKTLKNFSLFILICVIADSTYIGYISYIGASAQLNGFAAAAIAIITTITFAYLFVATDKSIVTSDLFSEEKLRRVKYKEQQFFNNNFLNKITNLIFYAFYLLTSPARVLLSTNPAAALVLSFRVVLMIGVHAGLIIIFFIFSSNQVTDSIKTYNRKAITTIEKNVKAEVETSMRDDAELNFLKESRALRQRLLTQEGTGGPNTLAGPGPKYRIYKNEIADLDVKIKKREELLQKPLGVFDFQKVTEQLLENPTLNSVLSELAAKYNIDFQKITLESKAAFVIDGIKQNPMSFISQMAPVFGMSLVLIIPLFLLILMKVFQNRSVRHYFDAELQEHYQYYKSGTYNMILSQKVQSPNAETKIECILFSDIYYEVIKKYSKLIFAEQKTLIMKDISAMESKLLTLEHTLDTEKQQHDKISAELTQLTEKLKSLIISANASEVDISTITTERSEEISRKRAALADKDVIISRTTAECGGLRNEIAKIKREHAGFNTTTSADVQNIKLALAETIAPLIPFLSKEAIYFIDGSKKSS